MDLKKMKIGETVLADLDTAKRVFMAIYIGKMGSWDDNTIPTLAKDYDLSEKEEKELLTWVIKNYGRGAYYKGKVHAATGYDTYKKDHPETEISKQDWEKSQKEKQEKAKKAI